MSETDMLSGAPLSGDIHPGEGFASRTAPVVPPLYQSTTFALDDRTYKDIQSNDGLEEVWYTRFGNPTVAAAASAIAALEGAPAAVMTSSGMAAIATTILTLCRAGDRVVSARELYGDTRDLFARDVPALGMRVDFVDVADLSAWREAIEGQPVRMVFAEALSNPQLRLLDVPAVADLAHGAGARFVVDSTFASPHMIRPLSLGADVVVHSVTKFLNGHSDVVAGCVLSDLDFVREVRRRIITFGGCLDPHAAFLVWRGLRTFEVRVERQFATARRLADFLQAREDVVRVLHPSLESYPQRDAAKRLLRPGRGGAMLTLVVAGGDDRAAALMRHLTVPTEATSLGGVDSLVSSPSNSSHFSLTAEERERAGIEPGMIRLSVGLEDPDALIEDLGSALDATVHIGQEVDR